ncbi:MAG: EamA family transporter [Bacillota bacterium]|nr:EamA family transporter [Bacillota bacterium]
MKTLGLALLGALLWGVAPIFGRLGLRHADPLEGLVARTVVTVFLVGLWSLWGGRYRVLASLPGGDWLFLGLEAFFATFAGDLAYYAALKSGGAGLTAVGLAVSPLVTVLLGSWFLGESSSLRQLAGTVLIVLGLLLVAESQVGR